ncbi:HSP20-like chaperone [Piptocephalis cylindrospora]|uniref:Nuclear movement protein nudC n=1 Tax=Piptocephalis cylindrospora TaxID=1907219 RepID=A0A4P9Y4Z5_9FUNG|nr:HSP20-like chaperone [Piptocephalis cylindrospora]|eukprot:RKP14027.1 HSP20-like chaperone [Piptocephalis cylindrospora]
MSTPESTSTAEQLQKEKQEQEALPYRWKQTLADLDVSISLPVGTRAKMLKVSITTTSIRVQVPGQDEPVLEGKLTHSVQEEECTWTVEDQKLLFIHLEKSDRQQWWKSVVQGAPEIDTSKLAPENSRLEDLDGETRGMVEKMMFDQRQKAQGQPSSDELKKMEALKKFQDAHPEMDFSKTKML